MTSNPEGERLKRLTSSYARMEPDIAEPNDGAALASIAISLRRIADSLAEICALVEELDL